MTWTNFAPSSGFTTLRSTGSNPAVAALNLGQNWLTGSLNSSLALLSNAANIGLSVYDNQLSGTVPASFTAFSWLALAYNPALYGSLPTSLVTNTVNKLQAWSTYGADGFYSYTSASISGQQTTYLNTPLYSTGFLFATSIGLDRPLAAILMDMKAALDPGGTVLTGWNSTTMQFCPPWLPYGSSPGQRSSSPGYGRWLPGLYMPSALGATSGTSYCNDYGRTPIAPFVYTIASPPAIQQLSNPLGSAALGTSTIPQTVAPIGGISSLCLSAAGLKGSIPVQLRELRTTTVVLLSRNSLTGALPSYWGSSVTWNATGSATRGFDSCALLDVSQNRLTSTLPGGLGLVSSKLGLSLLDNQFSGTLPAVYASLNWVAIAYNPLLVGPLPAGFLSGSKLFAWSGWLYDYYSWTFATTNGQSYGFGPSMNNGGWGTVRMRYGYRSTLALC